MQVRDSLKSWGLEEAGVMGSAWAEPIFLRHFLPSEPGEVGGLSLPHEDTSVPLFSFTNLYPCLSFLSLYITNHCLFFQGRVTGDPSYWWQHCSFKGALKEVWWPAAKGDLACVFLFFFHSWNLYLPTWNPGEVQFRRNSQLLNLSTHIKAAL